MSKEKNTAGSKAEDLEDISGEKGKWGELPDNHFGYASDEERRAKRGLEDWELVDSIPDSQKRVPPWFYAVVVAVLLVAIGLSFPFWGERPGYEKENWIDWGFGAAILYLLVFGTFVHFMVNFYGSKYDKNAKDQNDESAQGDLAKSEPGKTDNGNNTANTANNNDNKNA